MPTRYLTGRPIVAPALAALLLLGALPNAAFATFITYTDRATFLADAATAGLTTTNEDFSGNPGDPFTITDGTNGVTLDLTQGAIGGGQISGTGNGNIILSSTAVSGLLDGIGFNFSYGGAAGSTPGINTPETGPLAGVGTGNTGIVGFFGVLSVNGMTISAVNNLTTGQGFGTSTMDNIVIVTGATVPEPGTLLLFTLGALGLSGVRYRRSRRRPAA